jgi:release factor glutamine methyltransferase
MMNSRVVSELLGEAANSIEGDSRRADVELLLSHALGRPRSWFYAYPDACLSDEQVGLFKSLIEQRRRGVPVAQILGAREFWSMELTVTSDTLIPRPETELLVELALRSIPTGESTRVLDLGTGTGAIALALARERPLAQITAIDFSARALSVAQANAARLQLSHIKFLLGDWFSPVRDERYDVIVSNPPYIAQTDPHLSQGDLRFEPLAALASGVDGLDAIRTITLQAPHHLLSNGQLFIEHGFEQGSAVRDLMGAAGLVGSTTHADMSGLDRVTCGQLQS